MLKKIEEANSIEFSACHDGYKTLKEGVLHCRNWTVSKNSIKIIDSIIGNDVHKVRSVFPLHPSVLAGDVEDNSISLEIIGKIVKINFEGSGKLKIIESQYYPEFGCSIDNKHLIYDFNGKLPSKITIRISW